MKKLLVLLVAVVMLLTFASCGEKPTLEEYMETSYMQGVIEEAIESAGDAGMGMEIFAEGNVLVYSYTFEEGQLPEGTEQTAADMLKESLDASGDTFTSIADALVSEISDENPTVRVEYLNYDGTLLASKDFPTSK